MADTSVTVTNEATVIVNGLIDAFMTGGEKAAEAYITALIPEAMSIPFVAFVIDQGVAWIGQFLAIAGEKFADKLVIDFQTNQEGNDVLNAATELTFAQGSGDPQAIAKATGDLKSAWNTALKLDGWGTPGVQPSTS